MDVPWAIQELESFVEMTKPVNRSGGGYITASSDPTASRQEVLDKWAVVKQILDGAYPEWDSENLVDVNFEFGKQRDAATQCIALLRRKSEVDEKLGFIAPTVRANSLHAWVWHPISDLWKNGHYREAIQLAGASLDLRLQAKLGRTDVTGKELVEQAFSSNPPTLGKPRLRVVEMPNEESTRSAQEGIRNLALAGFLLIRNLRTHLTDELDESEAIEQLAVLSLIARSVEACELITA